MSNHKTYHDSGTLEEDTTSTRTPRRFHVIVHNDDYTTMEFVQDVLVDVFHHLPAAAAQLMLQVHTDGRAIAGTYTKDIAETKALEANSLARSQGHPLLCTVEPAE